MEVKFNNEDGIIILSENDIFMPIKGDEVHIGIFNYVVVRRRIDYALNVCVVHVVLK